MAAGPGGRRPGGAGLQGAGGAKCKLSAAQVAGLEAVLDAGPAAAGYLDQRWTLARVADQVWRRFGVEYTLAGTAVLLHRIGWSVQVPARRAAERDGGEDRQVAGGHLAGHKSAAADLGAWLCWEDESGQGLRPPKGRTWGRRGCTPVVKVTGGHDTRVSLAALIAVRPGCRPRLIFRTHRARRSDTRKGFTETDYARFLDAAHQQLDGPRRAGLG